MADTPFDSRAITRAYFDSILLEQQLIGSVVPDTQTTIFGHTFSTPIMTAALSHLKHYHPQAQTPMETYAQGAAQAGAVHWIGMCETDEFLSVMQCGAKTIRIVKPYADRDKTRFQLEQAAKAGALAVGIDIDHMFAADGKPDVCRNEQMGVYTMQELGDMIRHTPLPFVLKGVLSCADARQAQRLGAAGIVVSHHNGRLPSAVPPLMVLPEIRRQLSTAYPIFVDCGICSGLDAYKALAMGATAVSVGMHLIPIVLEKGADGVTSRLQAITSELRGLMANTGVKNTGSFDASVLHMRTF